MKKNTILLAFCSLLFLIGCQKENTYREPIAISSKTDQEAGAYLGHQLVNAYSIQNMRIAYNTVPHMPGTPNPVTVTHLYGKIKVDLLDSAQISNIIEDTSIDAFPFPLDYEIVGSGEFIQDSTQPQYIYVVSPLGWSADDYPYTLIDSCCIPDDDDEELQSVEELSLQLTGNLPPKDNARQSLTRVSGKPSGTIRVFNTVTDNYEGVRNIKVKMNTLVRVRTATTNQYGNYSCGTTFYTNVNYTLFFINTAGFMLWRNNLNIAPHTMCLGVHSPNGYTYNMSTSSYGWYGATVNNAEDIFTKKLSNDFRLPSPIWNMRILLLGSSSLGSGSTPMFHHRHYVDSSYTNQFGDNRIVQLCTSILPDMIIAGNPQKTDKLYNTVFHESVHATHFENAGDSYWRRLILGSVITGSTYGNGNTLYAGYIGIAEMIAYYADSILSKYCWINYYNFEDDFTELNHGNDWFRPDLLDSIAQNIPSIQLGDILYFADSTVCSHCDLTQAMTHHANIAQAARIRSIMSPVCSI